MPLCPFCNEELIKNARFCPDCGKDVSKPPPSLCSSCGAKLIPGKKFCNKCGVEVKPIEIKKKVEKKKIVQEEKLVRPEKVKKEITPVKEEKKEEVKRSDDKQKDTSPAAKKVKVPVIVGVVLIFIITGLLLLNLANIRNLFKSPDDWFKEGLAFTSQNKDEEAVKCYDRALKINPGHTKSLINKGEILAAQEKTTEAIDCYSKVLELEPDNLDIYSKKADILYNQKDYNEAGDCYDRILKIKPDNSEALSRKGEILYAQGKGEEAVKFFDKALKINPEYDTAWIAKGKYLYSKEKYKEALKCFNKALETKPDSSDTWNKKGLSLNKLHDYEEAIKSFDRAIELKPEYAEAWNNKGWSFYFQKRYEESLKCFNKALEIKSDYADAMFSKGKALFARKNYEEAIKCYEKVIEINPSYNKIKDEKEIAEKALAEKKKREEARKFFDQGKTSARQGKYDDALKNYAKALEIHPSGYEVWYAMGQTVEKQGDCARAVYYYDKALKINPDYKNALNSKNLAQRTAQKDGLWLQARKTDIVNNLYDAINNNYKIISHPEYSKYWRELGEGKGNIVCYIRSETIYPGDHPFSYTLSNPFGPRPTPKPAYYFYQYNRFYYPKIIFTVPLSWVPERNKNYDGYIGTTIPRFSMKWVEDYYGDTNATVDVSGDIQYSKTLQELHKLERDMDQTYSDWTKTQTTINGMKADKYEKYSNYTSHDEYNYVCVIYKNNYCYRLTIKKVYYKKHTFDRTPMENAINPIIDSIYIVDK